MASWKTVCLAAALGAVLSACDSPKGDAFSVRRPVGSPIRSSSHVIGLVGSMSGAASWRGDDAFEGAHLAVHAMNRSLPEGEVPYELVTLDDGGSPDEATRLVTELASSERTVGIVYAGPPEGLPPAEKALESSGLPAVLCYGDLYSARLLAANLFQTSPPYLWQARRLAAYAVRDRRYRRVGALVSDTLSGTTAVDSLRAELHALGRPLTARVTYRAGGDSLEERLRKLRAERVEAIVVEASPVVFGEVARALTDMGARYRTTRRARAVRNRPSAAWRPQLLSFDLALSPLVEASLAPGTVVAESYARGAHYLPVPAFESFRRAYERWWGERPLGWEQRAYEAARLIGWASGKAAEEDLSIADALETLRGVRFGGGTIVLGADDHTTVNQIDVGLWVVPRPGIFVRERSRRGLLPWVPLARGFSIDGDETDITAQDWRYLFRSAPPAKGPPPRVGKALFGVTTDANDPVH